MRFEVFNSLNKWRSKRNDRYSHFRHMLIDLFKKSLLRAILSIDRSFRNYKQSCQRIIYWSKNEAKEKISCPKNVEKINVLFINREGRSKRQEKIGYEWHVPSVFLTSNTNVLFNEVESLSNERNLKKKLVHYIACIFRIDFLPEMLSCMFYLSFSFPHQSISKDMKKERKTSTHLFGLSSKLLMIIERFLFSR